MRRDRSVLPNVLVLRSHNTMVLLPLSPVVSLLVSILVSRTQANADAKRLYDDLMSSYNSLIRPVSNISERLTVKVGVRLTQLVDVVSLY